MQKISSLFSSFTTLFESKEGNKYGGNDVVAIRQSESGELRTSVFYAQFSSPPAAKTADVYVNDRLMPFKMYAEDSGLLHFEVAAAEAENSARKELFSSDSEEEVGVWEASADHHNLRACVGNHFRSLRIAVCKNELTGEFETDLCVASQNTIRSDSFSEDLFAENAVVVFTDLETVVPADLFYKCFVALNYCSLTDSLESLFAFVRRHEQLFRTKVYLERFLELLRCAAVNNRHRSWVAVESKQKVLVPSQSYLSEMKLVPGKNRLRFELKSKVPESLEIDLFLFDSNDRFIVSDIDGTITKSDLLGQMIPMAGLSFWLKDSLLRLFDRIAKNGYHFIYLTSRPVSMVSLTKNYIAAASSDGLGLPVGPVFCMPYSFSNALKSELLLKKQAKLKTALLREIQTVFSKPRENLFAGFGNQNSDYTAYTKVGIPKSRIFIVDEQERVKSCSKFWNKTISDLLSDVDEMFP